MTDTKQGKHTPGPWKIAVDHPDKGDRLLDDIDGALTYLDDIGIIDGAEYQLGHPQGFRYLCHLTNSGESLANARLIASAPYLLAERDALLAALQQIMSMSKVEGIKGTTSAWYSFGEQTAKVARAAIRRVEEGGE